MSEFKIVIYKQLAALNHELKLNNTYTYEKIKSNMAFVSLHNNIYSFIKLYYMY